MNLTRFLRRPLTSRFFSASSPDVVVELTKRNDSQFSPLIAHLALNRNAGKNSFSTSFRNELTSALKELHENKSISVLILKSNVAKVFCAGADLKERATMSEAQVIDFVDSLRALTTQVEQLPFPTIAAIEGAALGGGLELALACDMRIAGTEAILGLPETALAIIPGAGGTQRLPRLVGVPKAKELIFTAKRLNGSEAAAIGLVTECVPAGTAVERAQVLAQQIADKGPVALRMAKKAINEGMQGSMAEGMLVERVCYGTVAKTTDRLEGLKAFAEKRAPVYRGQ